MPGHKLTKADIAEAKLTIWEALLEGRGDREIANDIGVAADVYKSLKYDLLEEKAHELRNKPQEHIYIEYILNQQKNIAVLDEMLREHSTEANKNAIIGAVRARAELFDKLIAKGQEFGVFKKTPEKKVVAGIVVSDLARDDLKQEILKSIAGLDKMMKRYGDSAIIDVEAEESLHYGPKLKPKNIEEPGDKKAPAYAKDKSKFSKTKRTKTTKASRGRKPLPPEIG